LIEVKTFMRYRIGEDPNIDAYGSTDEVVVFTALLSILIGVILVWLGRRGRQLWLTVWSTGLIVASIVFLVYTWMDEAGLVHALG
jgi:hypothetical protein